MGKLTNSSGTLYIRISSIYNSYSIIVNKRREIQVGSLIFTRVILSYREFILFTDFSENIYRSHLSDVVYGRHIL